MPGITGLTVLQYIRQHRPLLPVVVMMMTGETGSQMAAPGVHGRAATVCIKE